MFNIGLLALVKMTEKDKDYNVSQTEPVDTANSSVQKIKKQVVDDCKSDCLKEIDF